MNENDIRAGTGRRAPAKIKPAEGFDWDRVTWGKPDEMPSEFCSYCSTEIPEDSVPLTLFTDDGHAARFCDNCQRRWWGMR
jgi:hypothetical protein